MTLSLSIALQRPGFSLQLDAEIPSSGVTAVCGASAAGKTTLLRCVAGLEKPRGSIRFRDEHWLGSDGEFIPAEQRAVACVFQDNRLFPHLSVADNLHYAYARRRGSHGPTADAAAEQLAITPLMRRDIAQLSGGELRRVAMARALCFAPQLLLLDEPLTGLDNPARHMIIERILAARAGNDIPMLYVGHDFAEISRIADRALLLDRGRLAGQGDVIELSSDLDFAARHHDEAAAIVNGVVAAQDETWSLTEVKLDDRHTVWLTRIARPEQTRIRLRIPAKDVSIATAAPEHSSILNALPCVIDSMVELSPAHMLLRLAVGDQYLLARITRKSLARLRLAPGDAVYAQIKSAALHGDAGAL